ncbi:MAG: hypothetical protein NZ736_06910 [Candidatus Poseidoniaceae archaeon]|nr:hypothetical protein [Candidatus Poseidoniaceae archaeon]
MGTVMLGGLLYSAGLVLAILLVIYFQYRKFAEEQEIVEETSIIFNYREVFGPMGLEFLTLSLLLIWIVPYGILVIAPIGLILSVLSPAGRIAWSKTKTPRMMVCVLLVCMIIVGSLAPISQPKSPNSWGDPLLTENPNAPIWPASQQYTWLMPPSSGELNLEIIQSISIRTPHQLGIYSAASSSIDLATFLGLEQSRLHQAVELLDDELSFVRLNPEEILLAPIPNQETHRYVSDTLEIDEDIVIRQYELRSLSIGASEDGIKVGEVLCAATSSWGGELQVLVIVRPLGHPDLTTDRYAESLVLDWLSA